MAKLNREARDWSAGILPATSRTDVELLRRDNAGAFSCFALMQAGMPALQSRAICSLVLLLATIAFASASLAQPSRTLRSITVVTEPAATVWIDGVRYGATGDDGRLVISAVPSGVRILRVRAAGFAEVSKGLPPTTRGDVAIELTRTTDEAELAYQAAETQTTIDREKAIAEYQRAIKLRPKYPEAYIGLTRAYSERGQIENAFKALQNAKRLRPGNPETSAIEGRLLKDSGEEEKAIAAFRRSIAEGRGFQPEAHTGLGLLYKDRAENAGGSGDFEAEATDYKEAAKYLSIAVKQLSGAPDAIIVYQLLGLIYEREKKFNEAIALYEEFLRIFPDTSEAAAVASFITQIKKQMAEQE